MLFQYNADWAQWKMLFAPQNGSHNRTDPASIAVKASGTGAQGPSQTVAPSAATVNRHGCLDARQEEQQVNLFWDHWRLRRFEVERRDVSVVEMEKEATRGGRSYGDAECVETGDAQPSHLLISLP